MTNLEGSKSDRLPPYNPEAEDGVIGSVLIDNDKYHEISPVVRPSDFWDDRKGLVWGKICSLMNSGGVVDPITLAESLSVARIIPDLAESHSEVGRMMENVPSAANALYYANIVQQRATARKLIVVANKIVSDAYGYELNAEQQMDSAERAIFNVAMGARTNEVITTHRAVTDSYWEFTQRVNGFVPGLPTGFFDLDDMTGGLGPEEMIVIAGRPSQGKTAIVLNICDYLGRLPKPIPTFFASLEMSRRALGDRLILARSRVPGHFYRSPKMMLPEDHEAVEKAVAELSNGSVFIDDAGDQTVSRIVSTSRRLRLEKGIKLVVVDYLQFISADQEDSQLKRSDQIAKMSKRFKQLAKDLKIPVVVLSQLNRENEKREDKRPRMSDLAESGAIERDADQIAFVHRPEYYDAEDQPGVAELILAKNRAGATGTIKLKFIKPLMLFENNVPNLDDTNVRPF